MKIFRDSKQFIIQLPPYKINITKRTKSSQYSCTLPPLLSSIFNLKNINPEEAKLLFYVYDSKIHVTTLQSLIDYSNISLKQQELKSLISMYTSKDMTPPEDLTKKYNELPSIDSNYYDTMTNKIYTSAYKMANSNTYRVTLPNKLFKDKIKEDKDNYILFTIAATKKGFVNEYGIITATVFQE